MSEININDLPCEMLTKVFRLLDDGDSKQAMLTCKLWNNLIESAFRWSLELRYVNGKVCCKDPDSAEQKMKFILTTNRRFATISISMGRLTEDKQILKIFERHGLGVVKLVLNGCRMDHIVALAKLLSHTPNLRHVVIGNVNFLGASDAPPGQVLPDLKRLNNLEMSCGDLEKIQCFRKARLTTMTIHEALRSEHYGPLVDFLSSQGMLTSLTVKSYGVSSSILAEMGKLNAPKPFRLTQLAMSDVDGAKSSQDCANLLSFVKTQAEHLTEIEMGLNLPCTVYECVFAGMPKLTTLALTIRLMPLDYALHLRWTENSSVHTMKLLDYEIENNEIAFYVDFLKKFPNIRNLTLPYVQNINFLEEISKNLRKLESLSIGFIGKHSDSSMKFSNLRTLHIRYLHAKINWNKFTKSHPQLAELTIERMQNESLLTSYDVNKITTNVDLQRIRIGTGFVADNRFFAIVRRKCTNLKVLDLHKSCISDELRRNVEINVLRLVDNLECSETFRSKF